MCMGFHVGYITYILFVISGIKLWPNLWIGMFLFACISSGVCYILDKLIDDEGIRVNRDEKKNI